MLTCPHDYLIQCEICDKLFPMRPVFNEIIDADGFDDIAQGVDDGLCNRITCSYCGGEFTFENPIMIYSWLHKTYVTAAFPDDYFRVSNIENALRIADAKDVTLRKTDYAIEATEKIHIAKYKLSDIKTEHFKVVRFPEYKNMKNDEEVIIFDKLENGNLFFSHRHFTDKIITKFIIPLSEYEAFESNLPEVPKGKWFKIDKHWVLKHMEDKI